MHSKLVLFPTEPFLSLCLSSLCFGSLTGHQRHWSWLSAHLGEKQKFTWVWSLKTSPSAMEPWSSINLWSLDAPRWKTWKEAIAFMESLAWVSSSSFMSIPCPCSCILIHLSSPCPACFQGSVEYRHLYPFSLALKFIPQGQHSLCHGTLSVCPLTYFLPFLK